MVPLSESRLKVSLLVADGPHAGKSITIRDARFVVGRDPGCQLRSASESISRRHCEILIVDDDVLIRDLGSTNGTYVNGERLKGEADTLRHGDVLEFGPLRFRLQIAAASAAGTDPSTRVMSADGTLPASSATPPGGSTVQIPAPGANEAEEIGLGPTRAEVPVAAESGPATSRVKPKQPPTSGEGISKAANELIKKMLARSPRRPPPGGTGPAKPLR